MWIPECNNHGQSGPNSLPLILPKPFSHNTFSTTPTHCFYPHNLINIPAWNKPLSGLRGYGGKGEVISTVPPLVSSRWNPTPEQLQALEEMYRRGIKTPSAQQIQQIAAKLRRFGKIEGKNVFYWFQNHKARERQKRRRQMELSMHICERPERRQSGQSRRYLETKHPKKLPTPSTCSTALEYSVSMEGEECEQDKWSQLDCREPQQHNRTAKNITEACCPLDSLLLTYCMPLNNNVAEGKAPGQENEKPFVALDGNILLASENDDFRILENGILKRSRTLQLFPVGRNGPSIVEEKDYDVSNIGTKLVPNQFFEFLPTKY